MTTMQESVSLETYGNLPPEFMEIAERELQETPGRVQEGVKELRRLIGVEPNLQCPMDDTFLIKFLRPCKFYPESAMELVRRYYTNQKEYDYVYKRIDLEKYLKFVKDSLIYQLPHRDQHGRKTLVIKYGARSCRELPPDDVYMISILSMEIEALDPISQVAGYNMIFDTLGMGWSHVYNFTPRFAKMFIYLIQYNFPLRMKSFHVINNNKFAEIIFKIIKPLLTTKFQERIHFHRSDWPALHTHIEPNVLPKEYGGTLEYPSGNVWSETIKEEEEYICGLSQYGYKTSA